MTLARDSPSRSRSSRHERRHRRVEPLGHDHALTATHRSRRPRSSPSPVTSGEPRHPSGPVGRDLVRRRRGADAFCARHLHDAAILARHAAPPDHGIVDDEEDALWLAVDAAGLLRLSRAEIAQGACGPIPPRPLQRVRQGGRVGGHVAMVRKQGRGPLDRRASVVRGWPRRDGGGPQGTRGRAPLYDTVRLEGALVTAARCPLPRRGSAPHRRAGADRLHCPQLTSPQRTDSDTGSTDSTSDRCRHPSLGLLHQPAAPRLYVPGHGQHRWTARSPGTPPSGHSRSDRRSIRPRGSRRQRRGGGVRHRSRVAHACAAHAPAVLAARRRARPPQSRGARHAPSEHVRVRSAIRRTRRGGIILRAASEGTARAHASRCGGRHPGSEAVDLEPAFAQVGEPGFAVHAEGSWPDMPWRKRMSSWPLR